LQTTIKGLGLRGLFCSPTLVVADMSEFQSTTPPAGFSSKYARDGTPAKIVCAALALALLVLMLRIAAGW
jgi:hypothetical protein